MSPGTSLFLLLRERLLKTAVILGAGFSHVGGLPLTRDLFDIRGDIPRSQSTSAQRNHEQVVLAYSRWRTDNPEALAHRTGKSPSALRRPNLIP
jgi:hypothetical protein